MKTKKRIPAIACAILSIGVCGCMASNNPQSLQQNTANATAEAKRDAGAIVRGIAQGLARRSPLDINEASSEKLEKLSGVTPAMAAQIVAHRPYRATHDLVRRHIVSSAEYDSIQDQITVTEAAK